ncbi:MAG: 5-oxoprolinase [Myxococcales bacterium]
MADPVSWQFWIDRGGTFTDIVARRPDGSRVVHKLLSDAPERYADAAEQGIRDVLGLGDGEALPALDVVKMGTTVATNALLERKGERVLLLVDRGLEDLLRIGTQARPDLFAREIRLPEPLAEVTVGIGGRTLADGSGEPLDEGEVRAALESAFVCGIRSVAVALVHAWRYPQKESRIVELAREVGFTQVSASHAVSPVPRLVPRAETAVVDAWLTPVLQRRVAALQAALHGTRLLFMQSNGGLVDARAFRGKDAILSGPAGGVVGAVRTAAAAGFHRIVAFDMGGTSTDVSHHAGELERTWETEIAGVRLRTPMLAIHTVAAGGGSICSFLDGRFSVGPDSAGAVPGPACYRRGGPLTITDCNVALGKIWIDAFPAVFGPAGDQPLDVGAARERLGELAARVTESTGRPHSPEQVAEGLVAVAVETMARAIRRISIERGHDLAGAALCCFGGAGGQHACLVADALGMDTVLIHPLAGVLSALGMGLAVQRELRERAVERPLTREAMGDLRAVLDGLVEDATMALAAQGVEGSRAERRAHLRRGGTDTALVVPWGSYEALVSAFRALHHQRYGVVPEDGEVVVEGLSVEVVGGEEPVDAPWVEGSDAGGDPLLGSAPLFTGGALHDAPVLRRARLPVGWVVRGPAVVVEATATTVVEPGWVATVTERRDLVLRRESPLRSRATTEADPTLLAVFNHRFMSVAEQMGVTLEHNAWSVNIKERRDYSCAVFDGAGNLVANAPHIPVHLGSMGDAVAEVLRATGGQVSVGDAWMLNDPYHGGTHLPDITVVSPVFAEGRPLFFVASRGHHADVGGRTPGSMPPDSRTIDEEGLRVACFPLVSAGRFDEAGLRALLGGGPWPVRNPDQNVADLRAQLAANEKGARALRDLVDTYGLPVVLAYMGHVRDNAAESVRRLVGQLREGSLTLETDDGDRVCVRVAPGPGQTVLVDLRGTSPQSGGNANAPLAVCRAVVLYVFRLLVDADIPLNAGCLLPITLRVARGSLLDPVYPAAVVAGNVETSQVLADALLGALGAMAGCQGTMNNLTFGDGERQYYETLCGGAGAGPGFHGASGVHTHMTNSRLTDPEILEMRHPVVVEAFGLRRGSGGDGRWRGGDGVIRRLRFLAPQEVAILSGRRRVPPHGLLGGGPGAPGRNRLLRVGGVVDDLGGRAHVHVGAGDVLVIETPGGGGWGTP